MGFTNPDKCVKINKKYRKDNKFENKFSNLRFCGFRRLNATDFAKQNQLKFPKKGRLS